MGKIIAIFLSVFILVAIIVFQFNNSIQENDQVWIYPLDDTYIHMAIGKNLSTYGQWGITKYEFSSSSSSILYTLLIATGFKIAGVHEYLPLYLNVFVGILIFLVLGFIAYKEHIRTIVLSSICIMAIVFTPLPALILSGMEHTLQIFIDLIFIYLSSRALESKGFQKKYLPLLILFAALCLMIRFEGVFIIVIVAMLFFLKKEYKASLLIFVAGITPLILFGIYSVNNGSYFIPNSLLMKGEKPSMNIAGLIQFSFGWLDKLKRNPHLLTLFIGLCAYYVFLKYKKFPEWSRTSNITIILVGTVIIHLTLAKTGWFFRYEAYLVFIGIVAFMWLINDQFQNFLIKKDSLITYLVVLVLLMPCLYPLYARGKDAYLMTVPATKNIYEQQYQMARFLRKHYNEASVCANDIGAICFFTDIKLFDIFGLGSIEIINLRMKKKFDQENIYKVSLQKNSEIVIVYEDWFIGKIPNEWAKVGTWSISNNVILGGDMVSFFATEKYDPHLLKNNLEDFSTSLPKQVKQNLLH